MDNKDAEYFKNELMAILEGDVKTLREKFGFLDGETLESFIESRFTQDMSISGFALNKSYETELALDDDAHIIFYHRFTDAQYVVSHAGDCFTIHNNKVDLIVEGHTVNALYDVASKNESFARNDFYMVAGEVDMRASENKFVISDEDIKPIKKVAFKM